MAEKVFAEGIYLKTPGANAPDFIKANVSIHVEKAIAWLKAQTPDEKGYVRIVGKESKDGKTYFELDTWKPTKKEEGKVSPPEFPEEDINPEDIPF